MKRSGFALHIRAFGVEVEETFMAHLSHVELGHFTAVAEGRRNVCEQVKKSGNLLNQKTATGRIGLLKKVPLYPSMTAADWR